MPTTIDSAGITFNDATSLTSANIGTAQLVNGSVTAAKLGTTEQGQIAKAWVNFNGTLTSPISPNSSFNVSTVTKHAAGDYTINFSNSLSNINYSVVGSSREASSGNFSRIISENGVNQLKTISQVRISARDIGNSLSESNSISIVIFGN
jgi:hypothetical protein